ncbi:uracil-DNA glycosylase family protein [Polycladidibacter stylochi]|uniref:uracil-DNA glycosylase family protein n=1 Tax=Polycladidibacter stylochi TaxID=1807766 RepID=UPI000835067E|nr:uracil-DNA glycosylase family protein [Pseudovibrio stylochi]
MSRQPAHQQDTNVLEQQIKACQICLTAPYKHPLPHLPRPVVVLSSTAKVCIAGQAPGTRVHASGRPFTDPSGDRLRQWLGVSAQQFYNPANFAIVPMGLCFPGLDSKGSDKPPRRECKDHWHQKIYAAMPQIELIIAIGRYAHSYHLEGLAAPTLWQTVEQAEQIYQKSKERQQLGLGPSVFPLPHPSWRNSAALNSRPWFSQSTLPRLRKALAPLIGNNL